MNLLFGIDLGGTKIEGVVLKSKTDPSVIARLRVPTESAKGYEHIIGQIAKVVAALEKEVTSCACPTRASASRC